MSRGYGFLLFDGPEAANQVLTQLNGTQIPGKLASFLHCHEQVPNGTPAVRWNTWTFAKTNSWGQRGSDRPVTKPQAEHWLLAQQDLHRILPGQKAAAAPLLTPYFYVM